jgi:hypothetical protein
MRVSYIVNVVCLLHFSATLVAFLREVHYKGYITEVFEPAQKCKIQISVFIRHELDLDSPV